MQNLENKEMAIASPTSVSSSTGSSSGSSHGWVKWSRQELLKIHNPETRNEFFQSSKIGKIKEFISKNFPGRSESAIRQKIWQIDYGRVKFCDTCGAKIIS